MRPAEFLKELDEGRLIEAITQAELRSSGEIRVFVSRKRVPDALSEAQVQFLQLGMEKTRERNGVLIFIAPLSCTFAVVGDTGIHKRAGAQLWQSVAAAMETHLRHHHYTEALLAAIEQVGAVLTAQFPRQPGDQNELPNQLAGD